MLGIYAYFDKKDNSVAYVGKDSNIEKNQRHKEHLRPSRYDDQPFNRILQSNPNPIKCFKLRHNGYEVPIGGFIDFTSVEIISDLNKEEVDS